MSESGDGFERPNWDAYFMIQAILAKLRSNCLTRQIGAVIVKNNRQISTGYNGTPSGFLNCYEGGCKRCSDRVKGSIKSGEGLERCICVHAEANAIMQCVMFGNAGSTRNATLYSTLSPCIECSKMAITVGIDRVVILSKYSEDGTQILEEGGIKIVEMNQHKLEFWTKKLFGQV
ncbi:MAG: cytidine/deoxycytidylate deaminase family protein [Candidatus Nitrosocosmicus sp.]|uniref:deoxycytidylate deaminase n=1 Tax=Candidatus Nitrosocosmicus agrestis TaxID=2563600 RepID=UPI00122E1B26|nr:dCMP deaminase family protein [Candidatus Nitrosocosmicus sp. SS]KAA2282424.1 dCMP deaminase family protein [Candidatus Nitrosocosmicus sp. SS]KAF0867982.1 dCMP deaminase family protein [Candidatus Nitrosocosmicus sp. SS]MDR4489732.1 dCMP deaminase family protein [Candidatus Nitrosocosmicus sp.]HET6591039.1 dCMP deaminase family protein [Candidatus Nitrosocosmicus sp.]